MKKKIGIVILATMMATLVACGNESKTGSNEISTVAANNETENNTQENTTEETQESNNDELSDEYLLSLAETAADQFYYKELDDGTIMIKGYEGESNEDTIIVVPAQIDGKDVTRIYETAFKSELAKAIVTGKNVNMIEGEAFLNANVQKIVINGPVTKLEENTFMLATIGEISFGNKLEEIGMKAFSNCQIKTIKIPSTVKLIDQGAFAMTSLEEVYFEGGELTICELALGSCKSLKKVYIPDCRITFDGDVFYLSDGVTIVTPSGSAAEQYAKDNGISFEALD